MCSESRSLGANCFLLALMFTQKGSSRGGSADSLYLWRSEPTEEWIGWVRYLLFPVQTQTHHVETFGTHVCSMPGEDCYSKNIGKKSWYTNRPVKNINSDGFRDFPGHSTFPEDGPSSGPEVNCCHHRSATALEAKRSAQSKKTLTWWWLVRLYTFWWQHIHHLVSHLECWKHNCCPTYVNAVSDADECGDQLSNTSQCEHDVKHGSDFAPLVMNFGLL